jgi:hypothetical protein
MTHPDPDQVIGRLAGARLGRAPAPAGEVCPDAETLAAYADGGLSVDEVAEVDAHLARCAACRQLVAALMPEPAATGAAEPARGGAVILPFPQRRIVVWLSAAAGLLAAVTVWSVTRLSEPTGVTQMASAPAERTAGSPPPAAAPAPDAAPAEVQVPAAAPVPPPVGSPARALDRAEPAKPSSPAAGASAIRPVPETEDTVVRAKRDRDERARIVADNEAKKLADAAAAASLDERMAQVTNQRPTATQTNTVVAGVTRAHGPLSQQAANTTQASQNVSQAAQNAPRAAPPPPPPSAKTVAVPEAPPAPAPAAPARREGSERRATAPAVAGAAASGRVDAPGEGRLAKEEPASRLERSQEADANAGVRARFSAARASAVRAFAEPDGRLLWRIADGTRLESSSDGGTTWTERHRSRLPLHGGSAPSIDVAWAVGDRGLVLRRAVPGGWAAVKAPADVTLLGVSAASADAARVTAADGRAFETTDGGQTWTTVSGAPR